MPLILAAAGRGTRLGAVGRDIPKPLMRDPVQELPILHHLYRRLEMAQPLEHVIIVGASDSSGVDQLVAFTERFSFERKPEISIVRGARGGVSFSFLLGIEHAITLGLDHAVISVADSVASSYKSIVSSQNHVTIGVTNSTPPKNKSYTRINVTHKREIVPQEESANGVSKGNVAGIYNLSAEALPLYVEVFRDEIKRGRYSDALNSQGEYRLSWVWRELQASGCPVGPADGGELDEVKLTEPLRRFRNFLRE